MYTSFEHLMSELTDLASGNVTDPQKASAHRVPGRDPDRPHQASWKGIEGSFGIRSAWQQQKATQLSCWEIASRGRWLHETDTSGHTSSWTVGQSCDRGRSEVRKRLGSSLQQGTKIPEVRLGVSCRLEPCAQEFGSALLRHRVLEALRSVDL